MDPAQTGVNKSDHFVGKKDPFHPCSCFTETSGSGRSQSAHPGARRRPPLMPPGSPRNQGRLEEAPFSFSAAVGRVAGNSSCNGSNRQLLLTFGVCVLHELPRAVTRSRPGFPRSSPCGRQDKATASDLTRPRGSETDTGGVLQGGAGKLASRTNTGAPSGWTTDADEQTPPGNDSVHCAPPPRL